MRSIDRTLSVRWVGIAVLSFLVGCSSSESPSAPGSPSSSPSSPSSSPRVTSGEQARRPADAPASRTNSTPAAPVLPAPAPVRSWSELRRQAALRMVAANPVGTYTGEVVEPLLAIPVLEIELNRDGSIHRILVLREPGQAKDTTALAIAAVRRAAPFGDIGGLPKPWRFAETFLFNNDRKFKPRTLDP